MAKESDHYGMTQRVGFERALDRANLSNFQVFDMLFSLWDNAESGKVPYREFCIGISPLACPMDDLEDILEFALRVCNNPNENSIEWKDLYELLMGKSTVYYVFFETIGAIVILYLYLTGFFSFCKLKFYMTVGINAMASYFGDKPLLSTEVDEIIESVFEEKERISHKCKLCIYIFETNI